jgi:hypothetical protein
MVLRRPFEPARVTGRLDSPGDGDICSRHGKTVAPGFDVSIGRAEGYFGVSSALVALDETVAFPGGRCSSF